MPSSLSIRIEARQTDVNDIEDTGAHGDRDRSAQGVLDRCSGRRVAAIRGNDPSPRQPRRLPCTATLRQPWPDPTWAIEGASGLGAPLTTRLRTDGIDVVDVPAKLAARVRMLSTGHGRKNDDADAVSVAIAARSAPRLNSAAVDGTVIALRAVAEHRDDLVKTRTQTVSRLHVVLTHLIPAGASRDLTAERAAELLRGIRPRDTAGGALRGLAADLVAEIRQLDRRIAKTAADIQTAVTESGTTLTDLCGTFQSHRLGSRWHLHDLVRWAPDLGVGRSTT
jgi:transposase